MVLEDNYSNIYKKIKTQGFNAESDIYISGDELYKIYNDRIDLVQREYHVDILMNLDHIESAILPTDKIYINNRFVGIAMKYKKGYNNLSKVIKKIDFKKSINMGNELSLALKKLHENGLIVGDIHGDNIITNFEKSYFCDLDGMKFELDNYLSESLYYLYYNMKSLPINENQMTDNIKLLTYILSSLYQFDFEILLNTRGTKFLAKLIEQLNLPEAIKYFITNIYELQAQPIYFCDYSELFNGCEEKIESDKYDIVQKIKFIK